MATSESLVPDHPTIDRPVEKSGEEIPTKQAEIPPSEEDEEKEHPKVEHLEGSDIKVTKSEETLVDKQIEPPIVVEAEKVISIPVTEVPVEAGEGVEKQPEEKPATEVVETKPVEEQEFKPVENILEKKQDTGITEHEPAEKPEAEAIPEGKPAVQIVENCPEEKAAIIEPEEKPVIEAIKNDSEEKPAVECKPEEIPAIQAVEIEPVEKPAIGTVENTPDDKVTIYEEEKPAIKEAYNELEKDLVIEAAEKEPKEQVLVKPVEVKLEDSDVKIVERNPLLEGNSQPVEHVEVLPSKDSEPELTKQPEEVSEAECKTVEKPEIGDVAEKIDDKPAENVVGEVTKDELPQDHPHGGVEVVEKNEDKPRENVETTVLDDEVPQKDLNVLSSDASEVAEKSLVGEQNWRDLELIKENVKVETCASVQSDKDKDVEENVNGANETSGTAVPVTESEDPESDVKAEETVETNANKLETTKEVSEAIKSDSPTLESSKDSDETKTSRDLPEQEVSVKPAQKQSGGIISKVKHSLVKVKKAIIGKSPSSKKLSPDAKVDENVEKVQQG